MRKPFPLFLRATGIILIVWVAIISFGPRFIHTTIFKALGVVVLSSAAAAVVIVWQFKVSPGNNRASAPWDRLLEHAFSKLFAIAALALSLLLLGSSVIFARSLSSYTGQVLMGIGIVIGCTGFVILLLAQLRRKR